MLTPSIDQFYLDIMDISDTYETSLSVHEFPFTNKNEIENLGQKTRRISIRCIFQQNPPLNAQPGDKFLPTYSRHFNFLNYLKSNQEQYILTHPAYGELSGQVQNVTTEHDDTVNYVEVSLDFLEIFQEREVVANLSPVSETAADWVKQNEQNLNDINNSNKLVTNQAQWVGELVLTKAEFDAYLPSVVSQPNSIINTIYYGTDVPSQYMFSINSALDRVVQSFESGRDVPVSFLNNIIVGVRSFKATLENATDQSRAHVMGASRVAYESAVVYEDDDKRSEEIKNKEKTPTFDIAGQKTGEIEQLTPAMTSTELEKSLGEVRTFLNEAIDIDRNSRFLNDQARTLQDYVNKIKLDRARLEIKRYPLQTLHDIARTNGISYQAAERILKLNPTIKNPTFSGGDVTIPIPPPPEPPIPEGFFTVGSSGTQAGAPAFQGITGIQGPVGPQGSQGDTGLQGAEGDTGIQGETGAGIQGATGVQGDTGIAGIDGQTGVQGIQGDTGVQGIQGTTGVQGNTGVQGVQGNTGIQGDTGVQGIQGNTGVQGDTGVQGIQGNTGVQGTTGVQGIQGNTGVQGDTGVQGIQGNTGVQGIQGDTGVQGIQGDTGVQGIQGDTGVQGIQGTTGVQGIQGTTGVQGSTGAGIQGVTGIQFWDRNVGNAVLYPTNIGDSVGIGTTNPRTIGTWTDTIQQTIHLNASTVEFGVDANVTSGGANAGNLNLLCTNAVNDLRWYRIRTTEGITYMQAVGADSTADHPNMMSFDHDTGFISVGPDATSYEYPMEIRYDSAVQPALALSTESANGRQPQIVFRNNNPIQTRFRIWLDGNWLRINGFTSTNAQIIINDTGRMGIGAIPVANAELNIDSTRGGLLPPRMTTAQRNAMGGTNGLMIYNTTDEKFQGYEDGAWANFI